MDKISKKTCCKDEKYFIIIIEKKKEVVLMNLAECKLTPNEKNVLKLLTDEFHGSAFTKEMADNTELFTIQQIVWHLEQIYKKGLLNKNKNLYKGKIYTQYEVNNFYHYGVEIK